LWCGHGIGLNEGVIVSVGWPALCGPTAEGSTISLPSQALRRFGPVLSEA
jgi:hypothetical protein